MTARRTYVLALALSLLVLVTIAYGALLGAPFGVAMSTGESMGEEQHVLNVWVQGEPEVGDVVMFEATDAGLSHDRGTHRVVDETDAGLITQGDANARTDQEMGAEPITDETLLGVVVYRIPLRDALVMAGLVLGPVAVVSELRNPSLPRPI
ncbi:S24/S26 family peptidase [Halobiforma nitratireducens]|uniref:Peptidase S26B, signal peptidase n=1 Tax=Halobiforma nitratireducens JCM 10879 TaxID=1227454 RepID=M0LN16_9EURY|nr:hypothetical protein [Halobiforma nitratireducens]EMA33864.1 peptidase S26B, signal peptidase [Halobiforma nitratireducens JCM 10879]